MMRSFSGSYSGSSGVSGSPWSTLTVPKEGSSAGWPHGSPGLQSWCTPSTHAGVQERLVDALDSSDQALYLEQEIERFLNIKDAPVVGEMRA